MLIPMLLARGPAERTGNDPVTGGALTPRGAQLAARASVQPNLARIVRSDVGPDPDPDPEAGRHRYRSRHRCDPVRYLISGRASRFGGVGSVEAGPAASNPGPRAVLRRHAPSATRQRTLEANGIDCGASGLRGGLRHERHGSRPGDGLGALGDERPSRRQESWRTHVSIWPSMRHRQQRRRSRPERSLSRRAPLHDRAAGVLVAGGPYDPIRVGRSPASSSAAATSRS